MGPCFWSESKFWTKRNHHGIPKCSLKIFLRVRHWECLNRVLQTAWMAKVFNSRIWHIWIEMLKYTLIPVEQKIYFCSFLWIWRIKWRSRCILIGKILLRFSFAVDWCVCNQKPIAYYLYENGPEGLLEIPKSTIVHLQEWGRSEQGCTSKILAKYLYQLIQSYVN